MRKVPLFLYRKMVFRYGIDQVRQRSQNINGHFFTN